MARDTDNEPPVGIPLILLYHESPYFSLEACMLKFIRDNIHDFSGLFQSGLISFMAQSTASRTSSGRMLSYKDTKSQLKPLMLVFGVKLRITFSNHFKTSVELFTRSSEKSLVAKNE